MSRLIDADTIPYLYPVDDDGNDGDGMTLQSTIDELPTVKAIPIDQYEASLKSDMVAMLEQLDLEIQEQIAFMGDGEETNGMKRADNLVKDKINALKQSIWQDNYNGKKEKPKEVEQ